ncbi:MAG: endonuclease III domain-containing protein [Candidatus Entotheonellia bacterium]
MDHSTQLEVILESLERAYGVPVSNPTHDPLGELIATILSQNTSDVNSDRAYASLRMKYPSWEDVLEAVPSELAESIRSGGLANLKTQRIQSILQTLQARYGRLSLDFLQTLPMPAARASLAEFAGVGPKTIACVLLFACGQPALPVDTHIFRVTTRLGLLPPKCSAERAHAVLEPQIPPPKVYSAHVNLIRHGRRSCKAQRPDCQHCCLRTLCPYPHSITVPQATDKRFSAAIR